MKAVIIVGLLMLPTLLLAQAPAGYGIIPCDGIECQACHLAALGQNILQFLVTIGIGIVALMCAIGGMYMVTSGASTDNVTKGRKMIQSAVLGLIIMLAAWLIIDTVMKYFVDESSLGRPWNEIQCVEQPPYSEGVGSNVGDGPGSGGPGTGSCEVHTSGACAASKMSGFGSQAENASMICFQESSGDPTSLSGVDRIKTGESFSVGLFQINLTFHKINCNGRTYDCPAAFNGTNKNATIKDKDLYDDCVKAAQTVSCNIAKAEELFNGRGQRWTDWVNSAKKCNIAI